MMQPRQRARGPVGTGVAARLAVAICAMAATAAFMATTGCAKRAARPLVVSTLPVDDPGAQHTKFSLLSKELSRRLGRKVQFRAARNYRQVLNGLKRGKIDVALVGPVAYVEARSAGGANVLLKATRAGKDTYRGSFVVRSDSSITSIRDLKGKRIAMVDELSTTGYHVPLQTLAAKGLRSDRGDFELVLVGSHHEVARQVADRTVDAGACFEQALELLENPKELRVIAHTPQVPGEPLVVRSNMNNVLRDRLREAFLGLREMPEGDGFLEASGIDGFAPAQAADYDSVEAMINADAP